MLFSNHLICGPSKYTITFRFAPNHPIITVIITACVSWIIRSILTPLIQIVKKFNSRENQTWLRFLRDRFEMSNQAVHFIGSSVPILLKIHCAHQFFPGSDYLLRLIAR